MNIISGFCPLHRYSFLLIALLLLLMPVGVKAEVIENMPAGETLLLSMEPNHSSISNKDQLAIQLCDVALSKPYECHFPERNIGVAGKLIEGITISPAIAGEWRFGYKNLTFTPKGVWKAATDYTVTIADTALPAYAKLVKYSFPFHTEPLRARIETMDYMQDQNDMTKKLVTAHIQWNYPVSKKSLEEKLVFTRENETQNLPFSVIMNGENTEANVTVPITALTQKETLLKGVISEGVETQDGSSHLLLADNLQNAGKLQETLMLPSLYSYLQIESAAIQVVKNKQYVPEQLLIIQANAPLAPQDLTNKLEVFLLPKDKPVKGASPLKDYQWKGENEITPEILSQAEKIDTTAIAISDEHAPLLSVRLNVPPKRYVLVKINKDLPAYGGFLLEKPYQTLIQTPALPKEVKIMSEGALLSLSGEKALSVFALGMKKLTFDIARIKPENINHLISQTQGNFQNPAFINAYAFNENNIAEISHEERTLNAKDERTPVFLSFDFSKYLETAMIGRKQGLFLLTIRGDNSSFQQQSSEEGEEGEERPHSTTYDRRLILISDMGMLVKQNRDETSDIFAMDIMHGKPVGSGTVEILGLNGKPVFTTTTDSSGKASLPNLSGFDKEKQPVAYLIKKGNDLTFMPYKRVDRQVNTSRFGVEGIRSSAEGLKAYLFSDRGIYRPGETFYIGIMIKDAMWKPELSGLPLKLEVRNSRGQIVDSKKLTLNPEGFLDYSYTTSDNSATGTYNIALYISKEYGNSGMLGSVAVRVEDFIPDKMKITSEFSKKLQGGWVTPDDMKAMVTLQHLYGGAATNRRVTASISLVPGEFSFPKFKEYHFLGDAKPGKSEDVKLAETVTDAEGKASFPLNLEEFGDSTYKLTFFAEGYEPDSGRSVKTAKTMLISPRSYVVGSKADGNLSYINAGEARNVEFLALNKELKSIAKDNLQADTIRIDYISSLTKRSDGSFSYESKAVEKNIHSEAFAIEENGTSFTLPSKEAGDYALEISDKQSHIVVARVPFTIAGEGNISAALNRDASLKVTLNKASYKAGDNIELSIISPYTGAGLITIETDHVHQFKWFKTNTTSSTQTITIPDDFEGKGFVAVQFVRSLDSHEIYMSPFTYAVQPFTANIDSHDQKISLNIPKLIQPGEELTIGYKTAHKGKIIIYAIDEGILLYGHYKTPDPLNYFIGSRALEVNTSQIFDLLMPEYSILKSLSATGGDGWANDGKNLNPFKRKTLPPVAFWSGVIDSDVDEKQISFPIPDYFNGGLRVMAMSVSPEAMGAAEAPAAVKGDVIINPNLPLFAAPGDVFEAAVTLTNNNAGSGKEAHVTLEATPSAHLTLVEPLPAFTVIPEGTEKTLHIRFKATDMLGSGSILFKAISGTKTAHITSTLSIRPLTPIMSELKSGYVAEAAALNKTVPLTRSLYPEMRIEKASVSALPASLISGLYRYLNEYPYGCAEQITSKVFANVLLYNVPELDKDYSLSSDKIRDAAIFGISQLRELQNNDGGFAMWSYYGEADKLISVYITHMLLEARERGIPVQEEMFNRALNYVKRIAGRTPESIEDARTKAYAVYVITRNGDITANYLPNLVNYLERYEATNWKRDITALYIAAAYKMMQFKPEADTLLASYSLPASYRPGNPFYDGLVGDSVYISIISRHFPEKLAEIQQNSLFRIVSYLGNDSYNTFSSLHAIQAILDYSAAAGKEGNSTALVIKDTNGTALNLTGARIKQAIIPADSKQITFANTEGKSFFYQISSYGFDKALPSQIIQEGIELDRKYLDKAGNPVTETTLGTEITVELHLRSASDAVLPNIAVLDLLPGGFEIVTAKKKAVETSSDAAIALWNPDFSSKREDRMILFGSLQPKLEIFRYNIKATSRGIFQVPPPYAESMYVGSVKARGLAGTITVK